MSEELNKQRLSGWRAIVVVLAVLVILYFGLYYFLVDRLVVWTARPFVVYRWPGQLDIEANQWAHHLFGPAHQIDRRIRREYWKGFR